MDKQNRTELRTPTTVENKSDVLSKKLWGLESSKQETIKPVAINNDGFVPIEVSRKLQSGVLVPTNFTLDGKKKFLFKENHQVYEVNLEINGR